MKRVCIVIEVDDQRPDVLIDAASRVMADQMGGVLKSAYIDQPAPRTRLGHLLGLEVSHRVELYPNHHDMTGFELVKESV